MSRGTRTALVTLAVALLLTPVAALHPMIAHLYSAGLSNLLVETAHPSVLGFFVLALVSALPATGFTIALARAIRARGHIRALFGDSVPRTLDGLHYRLLATDDVLVFTAGFIRPAVFVSTGAERTLGHAPLRAALLHEEAHRRSQDILWRLLLRAVGRGFAFVPWVSDVVESETLRTECAADDHALRSGASRLHLFDAIVAAAGSRCGSPAAGLSDANFQIRLERLVNPETPLPSHATRRLVVLTAAAALPPATAHAFAVAAAAYSSHLLV